MIFWLLTSTVQQFAKKINSALFHLNSVKNLLSTESLTKLYYALIHPHILYCLPAYSFTSAKNQKVILNKQKQCVRLITKSKYNSHSEPLFFKTKILPLEDLIIQQKLLLMHSLAHNYSVVKYPQIIQTLKFMNIDSHFGTLMTSLYHGQYWPLSKKCH